MSRFVGVKPLLSRKSHASGPPQVPHVSVTTENFDDALEEEEESDPIDKQEEEEISVDDSDNDGEDDNDGEKYERVVGKKVKNSQVDFIPVQDEQKERKVSHWTLEESGSGTSESQTASSAVYEEEEEEEDNCLLPLSVGAASHPFDDEQRRIILKHCAANSKRLEREPDGQLGGGRREVVILFVTLIPLWRLYW